jgi:hypothetical protein
MAHIFDEDEREDLLERGFNSEQLQFLESLEIEGIYFDICKLMDDYDDSPSKIIVDYKQANGIPTTGGKRKRRMTRRTKKNKRSKRSKRSRKNKTIRKSRRNRR